MAAGRSGTVLRIGDFFRLSARLSHCGCAFFPNQVRWVRTALAVLGTQKGTKRASFWKNRSPKTGFGAAVEASLAASGRFRARTLARLFDDRHTRPALISWAQLLLCLSYRYTQERHPEHYCERRTGLPRGTYPCFFSSGPHSRASRTPSRCGCVPLLVLISTVI